MSKLVSLAVSALMLTSLSATAVTPTIIRKADTQACRHWVDSVYSSLTERQRVAQLVFPMFLPHTDKASKASLLKLVRNNGVGGLLFNHGSLEEYVETINYAQANAKVPLLITLDGEWGLSMRIKGTPRYPFNMGLGAIQNPVLLYNYGREVARECRMAGIHVNFAPDVDVNSNPDNPVIGYRSYGEDPKRVAALGTAYSRGLEDGNVQAVAKHFPGHGDTSTDSHREATVVTHDKATLDAVDLVPFKDFIDAGCSGLMIGHIAVPAVDATGMPASLSHKLTEELARDKMGFEGLIYTDALAMKGAKVPGKNSALLALKAGADVLLASANPIRDIDVIYQAVQSGEVSRKVIEERCKRILTYKYALGLSDGVPAVQLDGLMDELNSPEADRLNRDLATASLTVLRNNDDLLPVGKLDRRSIAIVNIGENASNNFATQCARYAEVTVYSTLGEKFDAVNLAKINDHDIIIAAVYTDKPWARDVLSQFKSHAGLVTAFMINPYKMSKFASSLGKADAIVLAYDNTGYTQEAAAQAIFGGISTTGKLPVDLPGLAKIGTGINLHKSRLGYTSPLAEGMQPWLTDSIDALVDSAIVAGAFPGAQVLVAHKGNVVHSKSYGKQTAGGADVTPLTVYDLASVSKATGTLPGVMKAYDLGLFNIEDLASKHIPGLRGTDKDSITVAQLLFHESGMPASLNMFYIMMDTATYKGDLIVGREDAAHKIKIQRGAWGNNTAKIRTDITAPQRSERFNIEADKGLWVGQQTYDTVMSRIYHATLRRNKSYNYSCLNFALLMDMEQHLTRIPHDLFVGDSIYAPIGAYTTCYRPTLRHALADIAPTENDTFLRRQMVHGYVHDELANMSGGVQGNAGLFSNADDLAKLCQMWLNNGVYGDARVLSPETVQLFTTTKSPTCRRGLGFDKPDANPDNSPTCDEASLATYGHIGFTGTVFWVDPENDLIFIFLCNRVNPTRDNRAFGRINIRPKLFKYVYNSIGITK